MSDLPAHHLAVALLQPQIAPNTGNIARLCVASACELHLVRPLGFVLSDRILRRSAMDYWQRLKLTVHDDTDSFFGSVSDRRCWLFDSGGTKSLFDISFRADDVLVFGSETRGIDPALLKSRADRSVRIPQAPDERCLNVSTATGIAVYEALRQVRMFLSGRSE